MHPKEREQAEALVRALVEKEGFEVLRLTVSATRRLVLTLDHDSGPVVMDDCVFMNRAIRNAFEDEGLPSDDYAIDVESPGVRRVLILPRHFERFQGQPIRVRMRVTGDGKPPVHTGTLTTSDEKGFTLTPEEGEPMDIAYDDVGEARLDPRY